MLLLCELLGLVGDIVTIFDSILWLCDDFNRLCLTATLQMGTRGPTKTVNNCNCGRKYDLTWEECPPTGAVRDIKFILENGGFQLGDRGANF